jgi:hypothetical protein
MLSKEHTPTNRPIVERVQQIVFSGRHGARSPSYRSGWKTKREIRRGIALSDGRLGRTLEKLAAYTLVFLAC